MIQRPRGAAHSGGAGAWGFRCAIPSFVSRGPMGSCSKNEVLLALEWAGAGECEPGARWRFGGYGGCAYGRGRSCGFPTELLLAPEVGGAGECELRSQAVQRTQDYAEGQAGLLISMRHTRLVSAALRAIAPQPKRGSSVVAKLPEVRWLALEVGWRFAVGRSVAGHRRGPVHRS